MIEAEEMYASELRGTDVGSYILWYDPADTENYWTSRTPINKISFSADKVKVKTYDQTLRFFPHDRIFVSEERPEGA